MSTSISKPTTTRRRKYTRRALMAGGGLLGCCVLVSGAGTAAWFFGNRPESNVGDLDFSTELAIPPLLEPEVEEDGRKVFDLTLQTGSTRIVPAGDSETWGVNGAFLGPTVRARRGDEVAFRVHNELPEDTSIHWHGMHLPAVMDGGPHQMIAVKTTWEPTWAIDQLASTLWYHPHPHGQTAEHVYKGVAGLFLVDDDESEATGLPSEYGVDDIPLIIQDRKFTDDGEMTMDGGSFLDELGGSASLGVLGDTILVNGTWDPYLEVSRKLVRFRLLNGSNARFYNLGFEDDRPFHQVATDNGLVPGEPVELTRLLMGPGERAEIVVTFEPGDEVILRAFKADLGDSGRAIGANDTWDIIQFRAADSLEEVGVLPQTVGDANHAPKAPDDATVRSFTLNGHANINGREMDMFRIDEVVPAEALEVWEVKSNGQPHTFHIHGCTFHVLEVEGEEPAPELRGPMDTVFVGSGHSVKLLVQFEEYTDPDMPYMFHCHLLRHEDNGMMGQFVVVEPGTEDSVSRTLEDDGMHHGH
jgi:FtsP/CotA-like multicopper oxidase with cupredoxin domain